MVDYVTEPDRLVCRFQGQLTSATCAPFDSAWADQIAAGGRPVAFDLQEVAFIASAFLRVCALLSKKLGPKRLSVINTRPEVQKVLLLAGFDQFIQVS